MVSDSQPEMSHLSIFGQRERSSVVIFDFERSMFVRMAFPRMMVSSGLGSRVMPSSSSSPEMSRYRVPFALTVAV